MDVAGNLPAPAEMPKPPAAEQSLYSDDHVRITNARAIFQGKTYAMAHVTSVAMNNIPPDRAGGVLLALAGLTLVVVFLPVGILSPRIAALRDFDPLVFVAVAALGLLTLIGSLIALFRQKPSYVVRIGSASGETDALYAKDAGYIRQIVAAVNEAIVIRG